jgi:hypothetical protein
VTDLLEELFKDRNVKPEYRHDQVLNELRDIKSLLTELLSEVKRTKVEGKTHFVTSC